MARTGWPPPPRCWPLRSTGQVQVSWAGLAPQLTAAVTWWGVVQVSAAGWLLVAGNSARVPAASAATAAAWRMWGVRAMRRDMATPFGSGLRAYGKHNGVRDSAQPDGDQSLCLFASPRNTAT